MAESLAYTPRIKTGPERLQDERELSSEALIEGVKLLRALHDHGVLDTAVKLVKGGGGLVTEVLHITEGESATRLLRNALELARTLSELNPESTRGLGQAVTLGVQEGAKRVERGEGVGLKEIVGLLRDRDVQVALGALFGTLKGFGRALRERRGEGHQTPAQQRPAEPSRQAQTGRGT
jgi:uncharacterized protein YjgD (DUF1641 family)